MSAPTSRKCTYINGNIIHIFSCTNSSTIRSSFSAKNEKKIRVKKAFPFFSGRNLIKQPQIKASELLLFEENMWKATNIEL